MFTAVVLDELSRNVLLYHLSRLVPANFEKVAHHMTLHMGAATPEDKVGSVVEMVATHIAKNNKVIAIKISKGGEISSNKIPHITIAVNRENGGKPVMSNQLANWETFANARVGISQLVLRGIVEECP